MIIGSQVTYREQTRQLASDQNWPRLKTVAQAWISVDENAFDAWAHLGTANTRLGDLNEAVIDYKKALELNPKLSSTWTNLGYVLYRQKKIDEAIPALKSALAIDATDGFAMFYLAACHHYLGQRTEMLALYQELLRLNPERAEAFRRQFIVPVGAAAQSTVNSSSAGPDFSVRMPSPAALPAFYRWKGKEIEGAEAFLSAVKTDVGDAVVKIAAHEPFDADLRVIIPERPTAISMFLGNPAVRGEAEAVVRRARKMVDDGRLDALGRSRLFSAIAIETSAVQTPAPVPNGFALWFSNQYWHLRFGSGDPQAISDQNDLSQWMAQVAREARTAYGEQGKPMLRMMTHFIPGSGPNAEPWYTFHGADYYSPTALVAALNAEYLRLGREVEPLSERLGGKLKVILTTEWTDPFAEFFANIPGANRGTRQVNQEHQKARTKGRIEALRQARIFDDIVVEEANLEDVPIDGLDYVLWQTAGKPTAWRYRSLAKSGDSWIFKNPTNENDMKAWVEAVRNQLRPSNATQ